MSLNSISITFVVSHFVSHSKSLFSFILQFPSFVYILFNIWLECLSNQKWSASNSSVLHIENKILWIEKCIPILYAHQFVVNIVSVNDHQFTFDGSNSLLSLNQDANCTTVHCFRCVLFLFWLDRQNILGFINRAHCLYTRGRFVLHIVSISHSHLPVQ